MTTAPDPIAGDEAVGLSSEEREALVEAVGTHCSHTGPPDYSLPNWCRDCVDLVDDALPTVERILTARLATVTAERDRYAAQVAAVEALIPPECWVSRSDQVFCTDYIGGEFNNGHKWTEDLCCLPCRLRAALDAPAAAEDGAR